MNRYSPFGDPKAPRYFFVGEAERDQLHNLPFSGCARGKAVPFWLFQDAWNIQSTPKKPTRSDSY